MIIDIVVALGANLDEEYRIAPGEAFERIWHGPTRRPTVLWPTGSRHSCRTCRGRTSGAMNCFGISRTSRERRRRIVTPPIGGTSKGSARRRTRSGDAPAVGAVGSEDHRVTAWGCPIVRESASPTAKNSSDVRLPAGVARMLGKPREDRTLRCEPLASI